MRFRVNTTTNKTSKTSSFSHQNLEVFFSRELVVVWTLPTQHCQGDGNAQAISTISALWVSRFGWSTLAFGYQDPSQLLSVIDQMREPLQIYLDRANIAHPTCRISA